MTTARQPVLFVPHGGGPAFSMPDPSGQWTALRDYLASIAPALPQAPAAVLVISAHWLAPKPTLIAAEEPGLLFDYYNFPAHTYEESTFTALRGADADLRARVRDLLTAAGLSVADEEQRGFDHGVFVPVSVMWPDQAPPIVQLSLLDNLSAEEHVALGEALAPLRDENVLIVGSGMSYHHMGRRARGAEPLGVEFDDALRAALDTGAHEARRKALVDWEALASARDAHPPQAEEHLLPLHVAVGAAKDTATPPTTESFTAIGWRFSGFRFD